MGSIIKVAIMEEENTALKFLVSSADIIHREYEDFMKSEKHLVTKIKKRWWGNTTPREEWDMKVLQELAKTALTEWCYHWCRIKDSKTTSICRHLAQIEIGRSCHLALEDYLALVYAKAYYGKEKQDD